jgi:putative ATP-binding cassette transporter
VAYERLTLRSSRDDGVLLSNLSVSIPRGMRVLVTGPNEVARVALFRATAGIGLEGEGRIVRPPLDAIFFLPQQPYLPPGTLRHLLIRTGEEEKFSDERILAALREGGLDSVVERVGGLDVEADWSSIFSLGERQQLVITRLILARPSFAILDRVSTTLGSAQLDQSLQRLTDNSITYVNFDEVAVAGKSYDAVLEIDANGAWNWKEEKKANV